MTDGTVEERGASTGSGTGPRVSIIIPAYNYARYLGDALESVLSQTFDLWECVVADDASTDDTVAVAESYAARDRRIRVLRLPHGGVSAARNAAIRASSADLVQFLDADDRLSPGKLAFQVRFLDEHPETDIVYGHVGYFRSEAPGVMLQSPKGKLSASIFNDRVHGAPEALRKLELYNFLHIASPLLRRKVCDHVGWFGEAVPEDYEFWLAAAVAGFRFDYCEGGDPVAMARTHGASASDQRASVVRGLIACARAFPSRPAFRQWHRDMLPLIYEVALGIDDGERGARRGAFRRIWKAAGAATEPLTALRWRAYAIAALIIPGRGFFRFVTLPIPEEALEAYRRIVRLFRGARS